LDLDGGRRSPSPARYGSHAGAAFQRLPVDRRGSRA